MTQIIDTAGAYQRIALMLATLAALAAFATPSVPAAAETKTEKIRIDVTSDEVEYQTGGKAAVFRGNVIVSVNELKIEAATLYVENSDNDNIYTAEAGTRPIQVLCGDCADFTLRATVHRQLVFDAARQVMEMTGGIAVCADTDCRRGALDADSGSWQKNDDILTLTGAPFVSGYWLPETAGEESLSLQARKVRYHIASGELTLSGDANITRGENTITGSAIHANIYSGNLRADADDKQRVQATFGTE